MTRSDRPSVPSRSRIHCDRVAWERIRYGGMLCVLQLIRAAIWPSIGGVIVGSALGAPLAVAAWRVHTVAGAYVDADGVTIRRALGTTTRISWPQLDSWSVQPMPSKPRHWVVAKRNDGTSARCICLAAPSREDAEQLLIELQDATRSTPTAPDGGRP